MLRSVTEPGPTAGSASCQLSLLNKAPVDGRQHEHKRGFDWGLQQSPRKTTALLEEKPEQLPADARR